MEQSEKRNGVETRVRLGPRVLSVLCSMSWVQDESLLEEQEPAKALFTIAIPIKRRQNSRRCMVLFLRSGQLCKGFDSKLCIAVQEESIKIK